MQTISHFINDNAVNNFDWSGIYFKTNAAHLPENYCPTPPMQAQHYIASAKIYIFNMNRLLTTIITCLFILPWLTIAAQPNKDRFRDSNWILGYGDDGIHPDVGNMLMHFDSLSLTVNTLYTDLRFQETDASISDTLGNLLFYTNGTHLYDRNHQAMAGWDTLSPGNMAENWFGTGYILPQGALILPQPGNDSIYYVFHESYDYYPQLPDYYAGDRFYYSLVNMHGNGGMGEITALNQILVDDYLDYGKINACRHANGRDWWIIIGGFTGNAFYHLFLLDPSGLQNMGLQNTTSPTTIGLGQSVFSPDGSKFAVYQAYEIGGDKYVYIYDFDRCNGILSETNFFTIVDTSTCGGAAISPNSRYLYLFAYKRIYQYDLWASDVEASKVTVAVWDGFMDYGSYATTFYLGQLAPDGRIYICSNNSSRYLTYIEQPDSAGLACNVAQHGLQLPHFNAYTMPHFPNFRLGSQPNSSCDTLGIAPGVSTALPPPPIVPPRVGVLQASPNPARDVCHLSFGSVLVRGGTLRVHDLRGRQVEALPLSTASIGCTLDVRTWAAGIYIASLYNDLGVLLGTVKVVKA
jgi:hypothetical protein